MATTLPNIGTAVNGSLDHLFRGRARWFTERDVMRRETMFGFRCTTDRLPILRISDSTIEDACIGTSAADMLDGVSDAVLRPCIDLYMRHHALPPSSNVTPIWTCRTCRDFVSFADVEEAKMTPQQLYEHCESQAEKWMTRAAASRARLLT